MLSIGKTFRIDTMLRSAAEAIETTALPALAEANATVARRTSTLRRLVKGSHANHLLLPRQFTLTDPAAYAAGMLGAREAVTLAQQHVDEAVRLLRESSDNPAFGTSVAQAIENAVGVQLAEARDVLDTAAPAALERAHALRPTVRFTRLDFDLDRKVNSIRDGLGQPTHVDHFLDMSEHSPTYYRAEHVRVIPAALTEQLRTLPQDLRRLASESDPQQFLSRQQFLVQKQDEIAARMSALRERFDVEMQAIDEIESLQGGAQALPVAPQALPAPGPIQ